MKAIKPSFQQIIIDKYQNLSQKEKKIADYIIKNHHLAFTYSAIDLAKHTGTSPATVVRFSQRIGYSGYLQLKEQIIDQVKEQMIPEERFKLLTLNENSTATVLKIAKQEVDNTEFLGTLSRQKPVFVLYPRRKGH